MKIRYAIMLSLAASTMLSVPVFAQTNQPAPTGISVPPNQGSGGEIDPGHPRVSQVQQRLDNQENSNAKREEEGKITSQQMNKDDARDQNIQNRLTKDEGEHGGHITKAEDHRLNHSERSVHRQKRRQMRRDHHHKVNPGGPKQ